MVHEPDGAFARATRIERIDERTWGVDVPDGWDIGGNVNGGVVFAAVGRAMAAATGREPVTMTAHYLAPVHHGALTITVDVIREGGSFSTVRADVRQDDRHAVTLLGTLGAFDDGAPVILQSVEPPRWPDPQGLQRIRTNPAGFMPPPFVDCVDIRILPEDAGFATGRPSGNPVIRSYWRLLDDEPMDIFALLLAVDGVAQPTFNTDLPIGWTPTIELTAHIRAHPVHGWLRLDTHTPLVGHGRMSVDGTVWDSADQLVAQVRQIALVSRPRT